MVVAGNETTTKLLGNALMHLSAHPEQMTEVFADHQDPTDLVAAWVEETLRFDTSSQMLARHVTTDVTMHGQRHPAGAKLLVLIGSATRAAAAFPDPDHLNRKNDMWGK